MTPLIFFGSDQYSAIVLRQLLTTSYQILTIVTDKSSDKTPVEKLAKAHNLKVAYYPTNTDEMSKFVSLLESWFVDTLPTGLCASFDHLIPQEIIEKFAGNLYNLHPSLLPQYRNVSPVQYAIALGDKETGITLFRISTGIDDGEIIAQVSEPILPTDTTPSLTSRLFSLGSQLFIDHLITLSGPGLAGHNNLPARPGPTGTLIFTKRLTRDSGYVEWPTLHQLLQNKPISPDETKNELLHLRLSKIKSSGLEFGAWNLVLSDLCRSLSPWPGVWSLVPTKKGDLRISIPYQLSTTKYQILISGKPKPISYFNFEKYYL